MDSDANSVSVCPHRPGKALGPFFAQFIRNHIRLASAADASTYTGHNLDKLIRHFFA